MTLAQGFGGDIGQGNRVLNQLADICPFPSAVITIYDNYGDIWSWYESPTQIWYCGAKWLTLAQE